MPVKKSAIGRTGEPVTMGIAGAGSPAWTANAQPKSTTTPYRKRRSAIESITHICSRLLPLVSRTAAHTKGREAAAARA